MLDKILRFLCSEFFLKIWLICFFLYLVCTVVREIIEYIVSRRDAEHFEILLKKYGVPSDINVPWYVGEHLSYLIFLAEENKLDSLAEAQQLFERLYCFHWSSKRDDEVVERENPFVDSTFAFSRVYSLDFAPDNDDRSDDLLGENISDEEQKYKYIYVSISYWYSKEDELQGKLPESVMYLGKRYLDMLYVVSAAVNDFIAKYGITDAFKFESVVSGYFDFTAAEIAEAVKIIDCPEFNEPRVGSEVAWQQYMQEKECSDET